MGLCRLYRCVVLLGTLVLVVANSGGLSSASNGDTGDNGDIHENAADRTYKRLFGETSEPLEPEEAFKLLLALYKNGSIQFTGTEAQRRQQFHTIIDIIDFDKYSYECIATDRLGNLMNTVVKPNEKLPALRGFFASRQKRMFDTCNRNFKEKLQHLHRYHLTEPRRCLLESLASVPDLTILGKDYINTRDDQVAAALYGAVRKQTPIFKWRSNDWKSFKGRFLNTVMAACNNLPQKELASESFENYLLKANKLDLLDRGVLDWQKMGRICKQILADPESAISIVGAYNERQKEAKRREAEKQSCTGLTCLP